LYKCIHAHSGEEIVILAPNWRSRLADLRQLDNLDCLLCQGWGQRVRVRAGKHRRWHFAHKHLQNCPFQQATPALLHARAVVYDWLASQLGAQAVDVETLVPGIDLPRPLDIWVNTPEAHCACWIIETRLQPAIRQQLQTAFQNLTVPVLVLFLVDMLHQDSNRVGTAYLTTTEREFSRRTAYDVLENVLNRPVGKSLHYLDAEQEQVTTLRDVHCIHQPQVFQGVLRVDKLVSLTLNITDAEIIHPGEQERLEKFASRQAHRREKIDLSRRALGGVLDRMLPGKQDHPVPESSQSAGNLMRLSRTPVSQIPRPDQLLNRKAVCMFCGKETDDWWYLDRATGKCKCRDCLKKGKS